MEKNTGRLDLADAILRNPGASEWLKNSLNEALERPLMKAANDAQMLAQAIRERWLDSIQ